MLDWTDFFVAQVGASAALAGLLFVAVSINLTKMISMPSLPPRALQALVMLFAILLTSSLLLVPGQTFADMGLELITVGGATFAVIVALGSRTLKLVDPNFKALGVSQLALRGLGILCYVAAGVLLLVWGANGLYLMVPGVLVSFVSSLMDSWVLLVEINR